MNRSSDSAIDIDALKINKESDATTYEGGGGDDSRRRDLKVVGFELAGPAAVPVLEAN